jgi:hypothetical protein
MSQRILVPETLLSRANSCSVAAKLHLQAHGPSLRSGRPADYCRRGLAFILRKIKAGVGNACGAVPTNELLHDPLYSMRSSKFVGLIYQPHSHSQQRSSDACALSSDISAFASALVCATIRRFATGATDRPGQLFDIVMFSCSRHQKLRILQVEPEFSQLRLSSPKPSLPYMRSTNTVSGKSTLVLLRRISCSTSLQLIRMRREISQVHGSLRTKEFR